MAKKKPVRKPVNDPALLRTGLDGFDELTRLIRQLAVDSESRAVRSEPNAYLDLQHLLREVRTLADSGKSAFVTDVSNTTAEKLSENCRIALTSGNYTDLRGRCGTCIKKITGWEPAPWVENTRPPLLIGTVEYVRENRARLTEEYFNHPARVADRAGQKAIRLAVNGVLESLNAMSSSLRKKLVGQGSGEHSEGKEWNKEGLEEAIKQYRATKTMEFLTMKNAIADGEQNAITNAQKLFGRNSIATTLHVSRAMVSNSPEWQSLADELGIERGRGSKQRLLSNQQQPPNYKSLDMDEECLKKALENVSEEEKEEILLQLDDGTMSQAEALARLNPQKG